MNTITKIKRLFTLIDSSLFLGYLSKVYLALSGSKSITHRRDLFSFGFRLQYAKNEDSFLNKLCDLYGSDKGECDPNNNPYPWGSHNYADFYEFMFGLRREQISCVLECGLGTNNPSLKSSMGKNGMPGASLRVWRDFFPNASIIGCDIDSEILFEESRISTFYCDQESPTSIKKFIKDSGLNPNSIDIIIDDGLHEFNAGRCFFENTVDLMNNNGIFVIEDVPSGDMIRYKDYFSNLTSRYEARFMYLHSPQRSFGDNNNLIWISKKVMT